MILPALLTQLELALEGLAAADFVALVNGHALKSYEPEHRTLTYTAIPDKEEYPRGRFSRIEEYLYALKWGEYSAVLYDGSVIQIEYRDRNSEIWFHRLCYQPCPVDIDLSDRSAFEAPLDETVLQSLSSGNTEIIRPFVALRL